MQHTTILGIDPGLEHTGWGIIHQNGSHLRYISCGTISTRPKDPAPERLACIYTGLQGVIQTYTPDVAGVEEVFVNKNAASSLKLGQARGIALLVPKLAGVQVATYSALEVKQAVVGYGRAEKLQIAHMVKVLLPQAQPQSADAADALAVAICTAHRYKAIL